MQAYRVRIYFDNGTDRLAHHDALTFFKKEAQAIRRETRKFYGKTAVAIKLEPVEES